MESGSKKSLDRLKGWARSKEGVNDRGWYSPALGPEYRYGLTVAGRKENLVIFTDHSSVEVSGVVFGCVHALERDERPPVALRQGWEKGLKWLVEIQ